MAIGCYTMSIDIFIHITYNNCMNTRTLNLSLPIKLVQQIDAQAKRDFSTRSDFIRKAVINQLRAEQATAAILDRANQRGREMGITSEQQVYDIIEQA